MRRATSSRRVRPPELRSEILLALVTVASVGMSGGAAWESMAHTALELGAPSAMVVVFRTPPVGGGGNPSPGHGSQMTDAAP